MFGNSHVKWKMADKAVQQSFWIYQNNWNIHVSFLRKTGKKSARGLCIFCFNSTNFDFTKKIGKLVLPWWFSLVLLFNSLAFVLLVELSWGCGTESLGGGGAGGCWRPPPCWKAEVGGIKFMPKAEDMFSTFGPYKDWKKNVNFFRGSKYVPTLIFGLLL